MPTARHCWNRRNTPYRMFTVPFPSLLRNPILYRVNSTRIPTLSIPGTKKILYYDCTNFYFEIEQEDELRRYGKSKEHRPNPIVTMGLFMDADGDPFGFRYFPREPE